MIRKNHVISKIRETRIRRGLSMRHCAAVAGISASAWGHCERGVFSTTWETLAKMAPAVGLRIRVSVVVTNEGQKCR